MGMGGTLNPFTNSCPSPTNLSMVVIKVPQDALEAIYETLKCKKFPASTCHSQAPQNAPKAN